MIKISPKTLEDLEFDLVLDQVSEICVTESARHRIKGFRPFGSEEEAKQSLNEVNDYISSFDNENKIPNHGFDPIYDELKFLSVSDYILEIEAFRKISSLSDIANTHIAFFKRFADYYPALLAQSSRLEVNKEISKVPKTSI